MNSYQYHRNKSQHSLRIGIVLICIIAAVILINLSLGFYYPDIAKISGIPSFFAILLLLFHAIKALLNSTEIQQIHILPECIKVDKLSLFRKLHYEYTWDEIKHIEFTAYVPSSFIDKIQYSPFYHENKNGKLIGSDKMPFMVTKSKSIYLLEFGTHQEKVQLYHTLKNALEQN